MEATYVLPEQYRSSHEFCFFLHDQLVRMLKAAEEAQLFNTSIDLKKQNHRREIENLQGEELVEWLEVNGYRDEVLVMSYQQLCAALTADLLHFVYESLKCSEKGKLTVSYALLRKPFKENLYFLEWMLARPSEFLERFEKSDAKRFNFPHPPEGQDPEQVRIISEAMEAMPQEFALLPELIHEMRFKKDSNFGLESAWQKANHLVTTYKHVKTEEANLNFIFSDEEAHLSQWECYYLCVPLILCHTLGVIEGVMGKFSEKDEDQGNLMSLRNSVGLLLYYKRGPWRAGMETMQEEIQGMLSGGELKCPRCETLFDFNEDNQISFYEAATLRCSTGCPDVALDDSSTWED